MNKFSKRLVVLFGFFLCILQAGFSEEWMPDGMIVDKRGNVILLEPNEKIQNGALVN